MAEPTSAAYRVLARKYRPQKFAELIGQDALVRTLTNAINSGRLAQAYMLTGVRGIGKTTTARIIARALNCVGEDGARTGPAPEPCGVCEHCIAIAADRHVDVIEMDAASRTGVDDVRDLIESVQYRPVRARTKVFIVDEVHMLSKPAFNALLKTLEEPPEHVKFVFATTEIRKVPVTVLSRCQRFDLRRLDRDRLALHLGEIAKKEGAKVSPGALQVLARAADGSVRDGLSLLDRALAEADPKEEIPAERVRAMLGLADRAETLDLFEAAMKGDVPRALEKVQALYRDGGDPLTLLQDLLEAAHWLTRLKLVPPAEGAAPSGEEARGRALAQALSIPVLARSWQMLLKGIGDVQMAPQPIQALEMLLVRLAYVHDLPTPGEIVKQLAQTGAPAAAAPAGNGAPAAPAPAPRAVSPSPGGRIGAPMATARALAPVEARAPEAAPVAIDSFEAAVKLFRDRKSKWHYSLQSQVRLVRFEPGRIEINVTADAPRELAAEIGKLLSEWTGTRWLVAVSAEAGQATLRETADAAFAAAKERARRNPIVQAALAAFPGADILAVRKAGAEPAAAPAPAPLPDDAAAEADPGLDAEFDGYEPIPDEE